MSCVSARDVTLAEPQSSVASRRAMRYPQPETASQRGHTLVEMMIVVAIIGLALAVAMPSATPAHQQKLNLAASAVADAFRFAREEARRTGIMHGVATDVPNELIRVFRLDEAPNPNVKLFDVRHPISTQFYTLQIGQSPYSGVMLSADNGQMVGTCNDPGNIAFDSAGVVRCVEPTATRIDNPSIDLAFGQLSLRVAIDSFTGRVLVQ